MHIINARTPSLCLTCSQKEGMHLQFCSPEHISTNNITVHLSKVLAKCQRKHTNDFKKNSYPDFALF